MDEKHEIKSREKLDLDKLASLSEEPVNEALAEISQIDSQIKEYKSAGKDAIDKANKIKAGFFTSSKAIEELKAVSIMNSDANIKTLDIVNKLSENQSKMADACSGLLALGAVSLAQNRAIISSIEAKLRDGEDKELSEETKAKLIEVIRDLKQRQDFLERLERQGARMNELNQRVTALESDLAEEKEKNIKLEEKRKSLGLLLYVAFGLGAVSLILGMVNLIV